MDSVQGYFAYLCGFQWSVNLEAFLGAEHGVVEGEVVNICAHEPSGHDHPYHHWFREVELHVLPCDGGQIGSSAPRRVRVSSLDKVWCWVEQAFARASDVFQRKKCPIGGNEALAVHRAYYMHRVIIMQPSV